MGNVEDFIFNLKGIDARILQEVILEAILVG